MAECVDSDTRGKIKVFSALCVPDIRTMSTGKDERGPRINGKEKSFGTVELLLHDLWDVRCTFRMCDLHIG